APPLCDLKAAANELMNSSCAGDTCCGASNGAGAEKLVYRWPKSAQVPRNRDRNEKIGHSWPKKAVCAKSTRGSSQALARNIPPNLALMLN
ncbi:MAG: hypothetical protein QM296_10165, partial [Bacillota bacterium]|nr:hypothetical protein [Bacillota bacterium]